MLCSRVTYRKDHRNAAGFFMKALVCKFPLHHANMLMIRKPLSLKTTAVSKHLFMYSTDHYIMGLLYINVVPPTSFYYGLVMGSTRFNKLVPNLPHCIQAGSGNPTAQKTYIKPFSFRKLQTCLSPSIHCQNTRTSCLQPGLIVTFTEQQTGR